MPPRHKSHGDGRFEPSQFKQLGANCVFETGVLVFHPETISLGENVYVGHYAILKGYFRNAMQIGDETWIGQQCFLHSAGGITIGARVGVGPGVRVITSTHAEEGRSVPVLFSRVETAPVIIEDDSDIGVGTVILPGVTIGRGAIVGAGAVVNRSIPPYAIAAGVPARVLRERPKDGAT
jgi:acetyltransferase-like isoleucine patch superfamily enzyme